MYSAKLSLYAYAVAAQLITGFFMILCSKREMDIGSLFKVRSFADIYQLGLDIMQYGGLIHIIVSIITLGLTILIHFLSRLFKLPMILLSLFQMTYCGATSLLCLVFLHKGYVKIHDTFSVLEKVGGLGMTAVDEMVLDERELFFIIGIFSAIAASFYSRVQTCKGIESTTTTMVLGPTLSLSLAIAFALAAPCKEYVTFMLGCVWFLVYAVGELVSSIGSICCFSPIKIILIIVFGFILLLSLVTIVICAKILSNGTIDYTSYIALIKGELNNIGQIEKIASDSRIQGIKGFFENLTVEHTNEQLILYMGNGSFLYTIVALCLAIFVFSLLSLLFSTLKTISLGDGKDEEKAHTSPKSCQVIVVDGEKN